MDADQLRTRLLELIESSLGMNSISPEEKAERVELMLEGSAKEIQEYIQIFEEELREINKVDEELDEQADEIHEKISDAKYDKIKADRKEELKKEEELKAREEKKVASLISELEKVDQSTIISKKKLSDWEKIKKLFSNYFKKHLTLKTIIRGSFSSVLGLILCGLSGLSLIHI